MSVIFSLDKLLTAIWEIHAPMMDHTQHLMIPETLDEVYHYMWAPGIEYHVMNTVNTAIPGLVEGPLYVLYMQSEDAAA